MNTPPEGFARPKQALNTTLWLILSLIANFFLVVFLFVATEQLRLPPTPPPPPGMPFGVKTNVVVRRENFTWDQVESTNYVAFIKNLRAVGCPEQTIRDIIVSEVNRLYARRRLDEVVYPNYQWWRSDPDPAAVQTAATKLENLESERRGVLNTLLGPDWDAQSNQIIAARGGITLTGPILGDLSPETKDQVYAIAAATQAKIEQSSPIDPMELVRLRQDGLRRLAAVLNPAQFEEYALRYSASADQLRQQLRGLDLTQDQFRDLYHAINPVNSQPIFYYSGNDPAMLKQQAQLRAQTDALIRSTLGEQLYASYILNQDPLYHSAKTIASQLGVPSASVGPIYEINRTTEAELDRIRNDDSLSSDEKVEAISQAQVEQQQSLEKVLGPQAFQRYLQGSNTNTQ